MHLPGQFLPADLLTKALGVAKFQALLPLCGVHVPAPSVRQARVSSAPLSSWKSLAILLLVVCLAVLLKGQDTVSDTEEGSVWLLRLIVAIVLCWEGARAASAACLRCIRPRTGTPPVATNDAVVQTEYVRPPRISENLEAYFTATGERWHQSAACPDIRARVTRRYLPCGRCTANQEMVVPPDVPQPIPVHHPPAPPVRRRNRP